MKEVDEIGVVYWSSEENIGIMAEKISNGIDETGIKAVLVNVVDFDIRNIEIYNKIVLGCPAIEGSALEKNEFEPFFQEISPHLKGKKVALFGSYGWGDVKWMTNWEDRVKDTGAILFDRGMTIIGKPDKTANHWCMEFGKAFVKF